jgi:metal-dependent HD superfamily phosphatase/phosphodiesterase
VSVADREAVHPTRALFDQLTRNPVVTTYLELADQFTAELGYTEHGQRHANLVARIARNILDRLHFEPRLAELAGIAGYLHDIGNVISRHDHAQSSALIAMPVLTELGMPVADIGTVMGAIGNHEEETGHSVSPVSAAVVIADKSDVHHSRVRKGASLEFDIHDRVNAATRSSFVRVDADAKTITLELDIDPEISNVMEYFEIFLSRMTMCRHAAKGLGCRFRMTVNGHSLA